MNFTSPITKTILGLVSFTIVLTFTGAFYLYQYQLMVNQGSVLADQYCLKVNPAIINRKNAYLAQLRLTHASASADLINQAIADYFIANQSYIDAESEWLTNQAAYLSRWDVKYLMSPLHRQAAQLQYESRLAGNQASSFLSQLAASQVPDQQKQLYDQFVSQNDLSTRLDEAYNQLWEQNSGKKLWQFNFVHVPESVCPAENFDFPDTEDFLVPTVVPPLPASPVS